MSYTQLSQDSPPENVPSVSSSLKPNLHSISNQNPCTPGSGFFNTPRTPRTGFLSFRTPKSNLLRTPQSSRSPAIVTPKMRLDILSATPKSERFGSLRSPFGMASPLRLIQRLTPRRNSWGACTPECSKDLEWSPHVNYVTPRSRRHWEFDSPLRGTPAKRVFSWGWDGEFSESNWIEDDIIDEAFEGSGSDEKNFFPLKDLDSRVTHMLHYKDYDSLPSFL